LLLRKKGWVDKAHARGTRVYLSRTSAENDAIQIGITSGTHDQRSGVPSSSGASFRAVRSAAHSPKW
jgi:hypothetical protein